MFLDIPLVYICWSMYGGHNWHWFELVVTHRFRSLVPNIDWDLGTARVRVWFLRSSLDLVHHAGRPSHVGRASDNRSYSEGSIRQSDDVFTRSNGATYPYALFKPVLEVSRPPVRFGQLKHHSFSKRDQRNVRFASFDPLHRRTSATVHLAPRDDVSGVPDQPWDDRGIDRDRFFYLLR